VAILVAGVTALA